MFHTIYLCMKTEFSIFRYQYWMKNGLSEKDAKQKVSDIQSKNSKKRIYEKKHTRFNKEYWMFYKGYNEEDAIKKVKEIQSEYSAKSSKFKGKVRSKESKRKISISMKKKIQKIGAGEWASHFNNSSRLVSTSKKEIEMYTFIKECIHEDVKPNVPIDNFIVDVLAPNKIVEFYGDYWHANPVKYKDGDVLNFGDGDIFAKDIWKKDYERECYLKSIGYSILIIWENDWDKNKQKCVEELIKFYDEINTGGSRKN